MISTSVVGFRAIVECFEISNVDVSVRSDSSSSGHAITIMRIKHVLKKVKHGRIVES